MRKILISIAAILALVSCSSENEVKTVAEKALTELGNGKYAGKYLLGEYFNFNIIELFKSPYFADYEIENREAANFIEKGQTTYVQDLKELFFETDLLFNEIVFTDYKELSPRDIYRTSFISQYSEEMAEKIGGIDKLRESQEQGINLTKNHPGFYCVDYDYCYIAYENVPFYQLTYKLDNKYLATVTLAQVKGEKPKVTSVFIR